MEHENPLLEDYRPIADVSTNRRQKEPATGEGMDRAAFGARIRALRDQQGMNQRELAARVGISYQYISAIETGAENANVTLDLLAKLLPGLDAEMEIVSHKRQTEDTPRLVAAWQILNEDERETYLAIIEARAKRSKGDR